MNFHINSHQVFVYTGGKAIQQEQPTIVFIHGAANDHSVWAMQSRYFAFHGYNSLAIDLPGHGKSEGSAMESIHQLSEWVHACLINLNLTKVFLVGHSMGSLIALEIAANHPKKIAKLALLGACVPMPVSDALLDASLADEQKAYEMINNFSLSFRGQLGPNQIPGTYVPGTAMRIMQGSNNLVLHRDLTACNSYTNGMSAASKIGCPCLVISGTKDKMTPVKLSIKLTEALKRNNSVSHIEINTGHALMAEDPSGVLKNLVNFFG